jgi:hypothetical protein
MLLSFWVLVSCKFVCRLHTVCIFRGEEQKEVYYHSFCRENLKSHKEASCILTVFGHYNPQKRLRFRERNYIF